MSIGSAVAIWSSTARRSFADLVLAAQRRRELKEAVTIEVVDPYARPKESQATGPDQQAPH